MVQTITANDLLAYAAKTPNFSAKKKDQSTNDLKSLLKKVPSQGNIATTSLLFNPNDRFMPVRSKSNINLAGSSNRRVFYKNKDGRTGEDFLQRCNNNSMSDKMFHDLISGNGNSFYGANNQSFNNVSSHLTKTLPNLSCNEGINIKRDNIQTHPEKILDAPDLINDTNLNLIDWSCENQLAVGLGSNTYLWDSQTQETTHLCDLLEDSTLNPSQNDNTQELNNSEPTLYVTSLNWRADGRLLAIGTNVSKIQIWDVKKTKMLRWMSGDINTQEKPYHRISSLCWFPLIKKSNSKNFWISSGSESGQILHHDMLSKRHIIAQSNEHKHEICALKWDSFGNQLASCDVNGKLCVWNSQEFIPQPFTKNENAEKTLSLKTNVLIVIKPLFVLDLNNKELRKQPSCSLGAFSTQKKQANSALKNFHQMSNKTPNRLLFDEKSAHLPLHKSLGNLSLLESKSTTTLFSENKTEKSAISTAFSTHSISCLSWCPWLTALLATSGSHGMIHLWNTRNGQLQKEIKIGNGPITSLDWSTGGLRELITGHGYYVDSSAELARIEKRNKKQSLDATTILEEKLDKYALVVWKYPEMEKICRLRGHKDRVLFTAFSAKGDLLASVGADETVIIWKYVLNPQEYKSSIYYTSMVKTKDGNCNSLLPLNPTTKSAMLSTAKKSSVRTDFSFSTTSKQQCVVDPFNNSFGPNALLGKASFSVNNLASQHMNRLDLNSINAL